MKSLAWLNFGIEVAWVIATVVLVLYGHPSWAVATFVGALVSGYSVSSK